MGVTVVTSEKAVMVETGVIGVVAEIYIAHHFHISTIIIMQGKVTWRRTQH